MNGDARTELLRWAAEEMLEWEIQQRDGLGFYWDGRRKQDFDSLTGWPGFGLAMEAAKRRGFDMAYLRTVFDPRPKWETEITTSDFTGYFQGCDEDSAVSAWLALRDALNG